MYKLPSQENINIKALSTLFKNTHTSYKYLLFQAILSLVNETGFKKKQYSFELLEFKMLEIAQHLILFYRLDFGKDDRISRKLHNKYEKIDLMDYVPYRLVIPFFDKQLTKGLVSPTANKKIASLSTQKTQYKPIYQIIEKSIIINPEWMAYFKDNLTIIESWALWHWANYLQQKNPNSLSLINKLQKPSERSSLEKQTKYWQTILNKHTFKCIFSGNEITPDNLSLDHFLPWSFVGHDQLWNLIPMCKNDNSAKSDNIPLMEKYLDDFIDVQKIGLKVAYAEMGKDRWENSIGDFASDFKMEFSDLRKPDNDIFTKKYKEIIMPLSTFAKNSGFDCDWVY